jgi:hypothetical protein
MVGDNTNSLRLRTMSKSILITASWLPLRAAKLAGIRWYPLLLALGLTGSNLDASTVSIEHADWLSVTDYHVRLNSLIIAIKL